MNSLGHKKKKNEVEQLFIEGKAAIQNPLNPVLPIDLSPGKFHLEEGENRTMVEPSSKEQPAIQTLIKTILRWVNNELQDERILVQSVEDDFYDGLILQKLVEKFLGIKLAQPEVTQSEVGQKQRLKAVLDKINVQLLQISADEAHDLPWSVEAIYSRDLVALLRLLVHVVRAVHPHLRLPERASLNVIVVEKKAGQLQTGTVLMHIIKPDDPFFSAIGSQIGAIDDDPISVLIDRAPDKFEMLEKMQIDFVNHYLTAFNYQVDRLEGNFCDGVRLIFLISALENYFVPFYSFHMNTVKDNEDEKLHNVKLAFQLLEEANIEIPKNIRAIDIVQDNIKALLRIIYRIYVYYRHG